MTTVGLMGFGRIGRNIFRMMADHPTLAVTAIADIADPVGLAYLLEYDTIYGRLEQSVDFADGKLQIGDRRIPIVNARTPADTNWGELGVDLVVQATGKYLTSSETCAHLDTGAKRVVLASTPDEPGDLPVWLRGVNDDIFTPETEVVALGSNTSNAIAPILTSLDQRFGLERAFFTTVHAMTNVHRLADVPSVGFRSSRAAGENIIPGETNTAEILSMVSPGLAGKLSGMALNVPVMDGSTVDLVADLSVPVTVQEVNTTIRDACADRYQGIIEYSTDPIVSSDVQSNPHSGIFDSLATMVMEPNMAKTITWFNNGWGYSARIVEVLEIMSTQLKTSQSS